MSLLERVRAANRFQRDDFAPLLVAGACYGAVRKSFLETLARWPDTFDVSDQRVRLAGALDAAHTDPQARTDALDRVCRALRDEGVIGGWRDEHYPVCRHWGARPVMLLERAAVPYFGITAYGVHMNGYVRAEDGAISMWIATRSLRKPTGPGLLDQMVAGGQPHGIGLAANMVKECAEEAGIPESLCAPLRSVGAISYVLETPAGLRPDVIFNFDLELPADFQPVNTDGEVERFELVAIDEVRALIESGERFKFNCALVVIDFLIRHGLLEADHPDYELITSALRPQVAPASLFADHPGVPPLTV